MWFQGKSREWEWDKQNELQSKKFIWLISSQLAIHCIGFKWSDSSHSLTHSIPIKKSIGFLYNYSTLWQIWSFSSTTMVLYKYIRAVNEPVHGIRDHSLFCLSEVFCKSLIVQNTNWDMPIQKFLFHADFHEDGGNRFVKYIAFP